MIFYNDEGEENGGLIFGGKKVGDTVTSFGHMSFDQYDSDQNMSLDYGEENGVKHEGLVFSDRPPTSIWDLAAKKRAIDSMPAGPARDSAQKALWAGTAARVYVGRDRHKTATVALSDAANHPRLLLTVDSAGAAVIEFLDATGKVTRRITGTE